MKHKHTLKGFTIIELLTVVAILAIISSVLLWLNKGSYQHSRNTLTQEYVHNLNKYVELYQLHLTESSVGKNVAWQNTQEVLESMRKPIPNTEIIVLKDLPKTKGISELISWNKELFQFEVNTKN